MDKKEEWRKLFANFCLNVALACFTIPILEPFLKGDTLVSANRTLILIGGLAGAMMIAFAAILIFTSDE